MRGRGVVVGLVLALAVVGCRGSGPSTGPSSGPASEPAPVEVRTETLVDTSRGDAARSTQTSIYAPPGSAGGAAVLGTAFNTCCVDRRIRAGVVLAGVAPPVPGGAYFTGIRTPLLVVHGLADPSVPFAEGRAIFDGALPPKWMLTVPASEVPSADHARPFVGTENRPLPDTQVVLATTTAFFDRYLRDDGEALARARNAVEVEVTFTLDVVEP